MTAPREIPAERLEPFTDNGGAEMPSVEYQGPGPQPGVDDASLWLQPEATLSVAAPMLATVREHLNRPVQIHVIGGMQVSGRLNHIDERDGVVTVQDGTSTQHVALHTIAVLVVR